MSVQLYRINNEEILAQQELLINREVDIVLLDNSVFHGVIKDISSEKITVLNIIRNKYTFPIKEITEIVYNS